MDKLYDQSNDWINKNVLLNVSNIVKELIFNNTILLSLINNFCKDIKVTDYNTEWDYFKKLYDFYNNNVFEWYSVTHDAFIEFNRLGHPTFKYGEMYIIGLNSTPL